MAAEASPRWPIVLMYHAVGSRPPELDLDNLFVPRDAFAAQLDTLARRGHTVVSIADLLRDPQRGTRPGSVLITFDDAYVSTLDAAAPLLAERSWPATVYVASQTLGGLSLWNRYLHEPLLDRAGLLELRDRGFAVGAHSRTHPDLRGGGAGRLADEIAGSRSDLAEIVGEAPETFAYPYGAHDAAAREAVRSAGYALAFAVHRDGGRFAWPRVDVNALDTPRTFGLKLRPWFPVVRRTLGVAPPLRKAAHRVVGYAQRGVADGEAESVS